MRNVLAFEKDGALVGLKCPSNDVKEGGLATSIGTNDRNELAILNMNIQILIELIFMRCSNVETLFNV